MIDEKGIFSQKTTFKGYDPNLVGFIFKDFLDLQNGATISSKSNLNWKSHSHGVKVPHRVFQCLECIHNKICNLCEVSPKINCSQCEVAKACRKCLKKITQDK